MQRLLTLARISCAGLLVAAVCIAAETQPATGAAAPEIAPGPFAPTMDSLKGYRCPDWFRDAKFGIWSHWGPQAVPMNGDWYAKRMYDPNDRGYKHHVENYGHPSVFGYKDIIALWKAEKWDPDRLMALYKKAGARYFVSMGVHHDNFDLWNSKHQRWNAVAMGPKRDVVGDWQKAAKKLGLRFGVSEHLGASFNWFQVSHGADKAGPKAGVPYDGADPKYQDLYHWPAAPGDSGWYSNDPRWHALWFKRIKDLVDQYQPDLLYTDGGVPFGNETGRSMIAHLYNAGAARHGGKVDVIYTCKQRSEGRWIEDLERGVMARVNPDPWQTDTSIGDWYYNKNWQFRPVSWVVHMLVDIVSKNGNLLLNVVQRPDGSLDPQVEKMLEQMGAWIAVHGEGIYETRPWMIYGEGAIKAKGGHFGEDFAYSAKDIRFTTKGATLYAFALGWPADGTLVIRALAKPENGNGNAISAIALLGSDAKLTWTQTAEGLSVTLPATKTSEIACALKITGTGLAPVVFTDPAVLVKPDAKGDFALMAEAAELDGQGIKTEAQGGEPNIGFWDRGEETATWNVKFPGAGTYKVTASVATINEGAELAVHAAATKLSAKVARTSSWAEFGVIELGELQVGQAGDVAVKAGARDPSTWKAINLRWVKLTKVK